MTVSLRIIYKQTCIYMTKMCPTVSSKILQVSDGRLPFFLQMRQTINIKILIYAFKPYPRVTRLKFKSMIGLGKNLFLLILLSQFLRPFDLTRNA